MGRLLAEGLFQKAACIWLTPLLTVDWLCDRIQQIHPRSLFVFGTADKSYQPQTLTRLQQATGGAGLVIEGADHTLEIPGDITKSLLVLNEIVETIQQFLNEDMK